MRRAARRQGESGHAEEQHEDEREALPSKEVDQAAERLLASVLEPMFDLDADRDRIVCHGNVDRGTAAHRPVSPAGIAAMIVIRRALGARKPCHVECRCE